MNNAIADQIKEMLVENLRIPENILTYDSELFGDEIGLDSQSTQSKSLQASTHFSVLI